MRSSPGEGKKRKLLILLIIVSFSIPSVSSPSTGGLDGITINEIMYNPLGNEVEGEWIELYNAGAEENIGGWNLTDQDGNYYVFPNLTIPPQSFVLVRTSTGNISYYDNLIVLHMNRTWSMLNNAGDDLLLVDGNGDAVDYVNYGSGNAVDHPLFPLTWTGTNKTVSEGFSLALIPDGDDLDSDENWQESIPSPGFRNCEDDAHELLITEVYYNAERDNEYIRIYNPTEEEVDLKNIVLSDSDGTLYFPQGSVIEAHQEMTIAENSTSFYEDTLSHADFRFASGNATPLTVSGIFKLKNDEDELFLKNKAGRILDVFCYGESDLSSEGWIGRCAKPLMKSTVARRAALEGIYLDTNTSDDWESIREYRLGQSEFSLKTISSHSEAIAFSSPDSSFNTISKAIDAAERTIHIALYKFTSLSLVEHLEGALERGVVVKMLLEEGIVQGIEDDQRYIMNAVAEKGGEVALMVKNQTAGSFERYRYLHSKYVVIDSEVTIVTSENWGASGVPKDNSYGNRGWGVLIRNKELAEDMLDIFHEDWNPMRRDISRYQPVNYPTTPGYMPNFLVPDGDYEGQFTQMTAYLEAAIEAARRGIEVRLLLDDSDYNVKPEVFDNDDVVDSLNELSGLEGLNLKAKLFNSTSHGVLKIHNKGMIVDGKTVLVSSINWNRNSITRNRETGIILENEEIGNHFAQIFLYDWKDDVREPVARGCLNTTVESGESLTFDASKSYDENVLRFEWDFDGDGAADSNASISKFVYETPGLYPVMLNVSDAEGNFNVSRCIVEVIGDNSSNPGGDNISTVVFFFLLISVTLISLYYAHRLHKNGQKLNK
jgi:phosphatidylserine/phosphatidylglycerophosphate/cardiolipin synthase-like enzyme